MENQDIITVDHVSMRFSLASEKMDSFKEYVIKSIKRQLSYDEFWALKDVSFGVGRGDALGLIGLNGSGKSTMLKVIAGVLKPISRLGFAIATIGIPDILIVDEVLSVGDFRFQEKCQERIKNMLDNGTTLLFVSHSIKQVKELCNKIVWLEKGNLKMYGEAKEIAEIYSAS